MSHAYAFFGWNRTPSRSGHFFAAILLSILFLAAAEHSSAVPKPNTQITLEPIEGATDTVRFHIGSPLFLRLTITTGRACEPFNGRPFFFSDDGAQAGWGFEEVTNELLFPRKDGTCERIVMLSSENSNLLAEGNYRLSVALLLDEKSELRSDTIVINPIHATKADDLSYSRFLLEQMLQNSPLLQDPATLRELFAPHLPHSPTSEVYHAAILFETGDYEGASKALNAARRLQEERSGAISKGAAILRDELERLMAQNDR